MTVSAAIGAVGLQYLETVVRGIAMGSTQAGSRLVMQNSTHRAHAVIGGLALPLLLLLALHAEPAAAASPPPPKHVVILLIDTLRWDYISASGNAKCHTPNIDSLAANGVHFEKAFATSPISAPSYASVLTSQWPHEHGVTNNAMSLDDSLRYLPEILKQAGMKTAAFSANYYVQEKYGFARGFDHFVNINTLGLFCWEFEPHFMKWFDTWTPENEPTFMFLAFFDPHTPYAQPYAPPTLQISVDGVPVGEVLCPELREHFSLPLTLSPGPHEFVIDRISPPIRPHWMTTYSMQFPRYKGLLHQGVEFDLHDNVETSGSTKDVAKWISTGYPIRGTLTNTTDHEVFADLYGRLIREYDAEQAQFLYPLSVEYLDNCIGNLIAAFKSKGAFEDTLFVLLSDHGEGLGEHGVVYHLENVYESLIRTPLIMHYPPLGAGKKVPHIVSNIDVAPTILDILQLPSGLGRGVSLLPALRDGMAPEREWILAETWPPQASAKQICYRTQDMKLIYNATKDTWEYFDVTKDPGELDNLFDLQDPEHSRLTQFFLKEVLPEAWAEGQAPDKELELRQLSPDEIDQLEAMGYL